MAWADIELVAGMQMMSKNPVSTMNSFMQPQIL
jgi:hypothetical protein